ncbi:hypothetical protein CaldiYA01_05160 [Caldicellulosiruptor diazotrophicus]|uniref:Uncharacterized protein n=1 Tax=Caldicellulosiruptor diazotrophicus TaxID=2806205 RepID=A0ABM7NKB5_9FIRM|nr:hypothetical protein CaldiYA01_05160 [Caldicellulosiruptor diazotrophicus]
MVSIIKSRRKRKEDVVRGKIKKKVKFSKIFLGNTKDKKANVKFQKIT